MGLLTLTCSCCNGNAFFLVVISAIINRGITIILKPITNEKVSEGIKLTILFNIVIPTSILGALKKIPAPIIIALV